MSQISDILRKLPVFNRLEAFPVALDDMVLRLESGKEYITGEKMICQEADTCQSCTVFSSASTAICL